MKSILFVCLGNICRSPMAEYLFRHTAAERGLAVSCASAGTSGWHNGEFMHQGTDQQNGHCAQPFYQQQPEKQ